MGRRDRAPLGEPVISQDQRGRDTTGRITSIVAARGPVIRLTTSCGHALAATAVHPIASRAGWQPAGALAPGALVATESGAATIHSIEPGDASARVFDLSVEPHANFYAGGILVHNKTVVLPPKPDDMIGTWAGYTDRGTFLRLELQRGGTGAVSIDRPWFKDQPVASEPVTWTLNRYLLEVVAPSNRPLAFTRLRGEPRAVSMRSTLHAPPNTQTDAATLFRPDAFGHALQRTSALKQDAAR